MKPAKYVANLAGLVWISGSILQLFLGAVVTSPREIISSLINLAAPASISLFGHKNLGVSLGCFLGVIGTALAAYPGFLNLEIGTIFGFLCFVCSSSLGIFSESLTRKFSSCANKFLRETWGHPRRMMGMISFTLARLPIIYEGLTHGRGLHYITPFIIWGLGDITICFSKANPDET